MFKNLLNKKKIFQEIKNNNIKYSTLKNNLLIDTYSILTNTKTETIKQGQQKYNNAKTVINNIEYDIKNIKNYSYHLKPYNYLQKPKDINTYYFIKRKPIKNISIHQILKELSLKGQISKSQYRNTTKRIKKGKKPVLFVRSKINFYLKTLKKDNQNKSISKKRINKNFFSIEINNINYKVTLKKDSLNLLFTEPYIKEEIYRRYYAYNNLLFNSD